MRKVYIQRHRPMYLAWWKRSWSWWYVAYGEHQPFARFGHGGWICLNFKWLRRFWKGGGPRPECAGAILLALLLLPALAHSQSVVNATIPTAPAANLIHNLYAGGVSYNSSATPAVAGTGLYARLLSDTGTYAFTAVDALPNTVRPFTVTTNMGVGVAQKVATIGTVPVFIPAATGISFSGSNTGWQWNTGALAAIRVKGNYFIMPQVRLVKSSVSNGSGYQPIIGVLFAWGN